MRSRSPHPHCETRNRQSVKRMPEKKKPKPVEWDFCVKCSVVLTGESLVQHYERLHPRSRWFAREKRAKKISVVE